MPKPPASRGVTKRGSFRSLSAINTSGRAESGLERFYFACELLQKMDGRAIDKRMDRVDAQAIDMKIAQPHQRVVAKKAPHLGCAFRFEIHRSAPRRVVRIHNVGPVFAGVIAHRAKVVVNHIEQHGQAALDARRSQIASERRGRHTADALRKAPRRRSPSHGCRRMPPRASVRRA